MQHENYVTASTSVIFTENVYNCSVIFKELCELWVPLSRRYFANHPFMGGLAFILPLKCLRSNYLTVSVVNTVISMTSQCLMSKVIIWEGSLKSKTDKLTSRTNSRFFIIRVAFGSCIIYMNGNEGYLGIYSQSFIVWLFCDRSRQCKAPAATIWYIKQYWTNLTMVSNGKQRP